MEKVFCREDDRAAGKDFADEAGVKFWVEVGATIVDDGEAVVRVGGVQQGGEDDAASCNAEEDERIDFPGAQDEIQVGSGKCADAMLGDDNIVAFGSDGGMDGRVGTLK